MCVCVCFKIMTFKRWATLFSQIRCWFQEFHFLFLKSSQLLEFLVLLLKQWWLISTIFKIIIWIKETAFGTNIIFSRSKGEYSISWASKKRNIWIIQNKRHLNRKFEGFFRLPAGVLSSSRKLSSCSNTNSVVRFNTN